MKPGTTPAMNRPAIETLPTAPYTTAVMLGGTSAAVVDPDISEKNMLNTTTTCDNPPLMCPTRDSDRLAMRTTTLAELMSSPTSRKNGIASSASESTPSKIFWTIAASETSVSDAATKTPAISENGTGTPR